jgi:uncharacterized protein YdhG (YjbR/CyaY superfamily)
MAQPATVQEYLDALPEDVRPLVEEVRRTIREALPESSEKISYAIPTVLLDGRPLISYGAWKSHLGLYPVPVTDGELEEQVAPYRSTKDTLRFRYRDPVPLDLIARVVTARAATAGPG